LEWSPLDILVRRASQLCRFTKMDIEMWFPC
jgi:hypothetical protein